MQKSAAKEAKVTKQEKEDLRIRRTRKLIQQAFIDLTVEQGFAALTVHDIAERAMVNRSTFYRHYLDKYDLLDQYMNEIASITAAAAAEVEKTQGTAERVPSGLLVLLKHIQQNADFYRVMLGPKGDPIFTQRFRQISEGRFRYLLSVTSADDVPRDPPFEMRLSYVSYAGIGAIMWWLENNQPCTAEQLAVWLGKLNTASAGLYPKQNEGKANGSA